MPTETDPARSFAELCEMLQGAGSSQAGDNALAATFEVEEWSAEFYQILFNILDQADSLINIIKQIQLDDDYKTDAINHVIAIKNAFGKNALSQEWKWATTNYLNPQNIAPIKMLSPSVRPLFSHPKFDSNETELILLEVDQLIKWLEEHQLADQDFVRQALIEGLSAFRFRLQRLKYMGWGYTIDSLRDVISAYFALERGFASGGLNPTADAMKKFVFGFIKSFYEKAKLVKDVTELGDWMLKAYAVATLTANMKGPIIALLAAPTPG